MDCFFSEMGVFWPGGCALVDAVVNTALNKGALSLNSSPSFSNEKESISSFEVCLKMLGIFLEQRPVPS